MSITWISLDHYGMSFEAFVDEQSIGAVIQANQDNIELNSLFQARLNNIGFESIDETTSFINGSVKYGDIKKIFPNATIKKYDSVKEVLASKDIHQKIVVARSNEDNELDTIDNENDIFVEGSENAEVGLNINTKASDIESLNIQTNKISFEDFLMRNLVETDVINDFNKMLPVIESEFSMEALNEAILNNDHNSLNEYVKEYVSKVKSKSPKNYSKKGMLDCAVPQYLQYMLSSVNDLNIPDLKHSDENLQELKDLIGDIVDNQGVNFFDRKMKVTGAAIFFKMIEDWQFSYSFKKNTTNFHNNEKPNKDFDIRIASLSTGQYNTYRYKVVKEIMENENSKEAVLELYNRFKGSELNSSFKR